MNFRAPRAWTFRASLLLVVSFFTSPGCREELGPENFPTADVSGAIVEGNAPISGGWVEFIPVNATVGKIRSARLKPDGTFEATRVPVGEVLVRLSNTGIRFPSGSLFAAQMAKDPQINSFIHRQISPNLTDPLRIDLLEEVVKYQAFRSRLTKNQTETTPSASQ
jgi:hypothetical protein